MFLCYLFLGLLINGYIGREVYSVLLRIGKMTGRDSG